MKVLTTQNLPKNRSLLNCLPNGVVNEVRSAEIGAGGIFQDLELESGLSKNTHAYLILSHGNITNRLSNPRKYNKLIIN